MDPNLTINIVHGSTHREEPSSFRHEIVLYYSDGSSDDIKGLNVRRRMWMDVCKINKHKCKNVYLR